VRKEPLGPLSSFQEKQTSEKLVGICPDHTASSVIAIKCWLRLLGRHGLDSDPALIATNLAVDFLDLLWRGDGF
jgi:hypothetical protein